MLERLVLPPWLKAGLALPLLVLSMALEIRTFIAWIALQRAAGRGLQLPGVHLLLPDGPKWAWLALQASAGLAAIALALQPGAMLARVAGGLWVLAALAMLSTALSENGEWRQQLARLPGHVAEAHAVDREAVVAAAAALKDAGHGVVLGRGFNFATAFEAALKEVLDD